MRLQPKLQSEGFSKQVRARAAGARDGNRMDLQPAEEEIRPRKTSERATICSDSGHYVDGILLNSVGSFQDVDVDSKIILCG